MVHLSEDPSFVGQRVVIIRDMLEYNSLAGFNVVVVPLTVARLTIPQWDGNAGFDADVIDGEISGSDMSATVLDELLLFAMADENFVYTNLHEGIMQYPKNGYVAPSHIGLV